MRGKVAKMIRRATESNYPTRHVRTPDGCVVTVGWRAQYKANKKYYKGKSLYGGLLLAVNSGWRGDIGGER